jgi:hypothetical protein
LDAPVPPPRVLPGQPQDQLTDLLRDRAAAGGVRVGPFALDQAPVPGEQGARCHDPVRSAQSAFGRATRRRRTATSCRSTKISASFEAPLRARSASQPNSRITGKQTRRKSTSSEGRNQGQMPCASSGTPQAQPTPGRSSTGSSSPIPHIYGWSLPNTKPISILTGPIDPWNRPAHCGRYLSPPAPIPRSSGTTGSAGSSTNTPSPPRVAEFRHPQGYEPYDARFAVCAVPTCLTCLGLGPVGASWLPFPSLLSGVVSLANPLVRRTSSESVTRPAGPTRGPWRRTGKRPSQGRNRGPDLQRPARRCRRI